MSLELIAVMTLKALKCPLCKKDITRTEDYESEWIEIQQIGGPTNKILRNEVVTLICETCNWKERTNNWKKYIV